MDLVRGPGGDLWFGVGGSTSSQDNPYQKRLCVMRCSPGGTTRWKKVLPAAADIVFFRGIAVDHHRNAVVVGRSSADVTGQSLWVITKLSPAGKPLWTRTVGSLASTWTSAPEAVAIDSHDAIYIVGTRPRAVTGDDVALIKYTTAGVRKWTRYVSGFDTLADKGVDIAVDASDRVYISGTVGGLFSGTDIMLARYTKAGVQVWNRVWDGSGLDDTAAELAVSQAGVAVAGVSKRASGDDQGVVLKAAPSMAGGALLDTYLTGMTGRSVAWSSVALNAAGNVAAGGAVVSASVSAFAYARFRASAPEPVASFYGGSGKARCYDVWLTADATLFAAGYWDSSDTPSSTVEHDVYLVSDFVSTPDWGALPVAPGSQEGYVVLVTGSAVYVAGESGQPVALWKFAR